MGGNKRGKQTVKKGGGGNKDLCVKTEVDRQKIQFALYVRTYVSGTGAEKVTKQTREKDGNAVFESIIRDIE